jgi:predicted transcriptional regulator
MSQTLLEMAKDLVMAQIETHRLLPDDMHIALQQTYASLKALQAQEDANGNIAVVTPETPLEPVHWRKSITKHVVTCLECGASFKQLSVRHLKEHGLDGQSYRIKYGIPRTQPLAAKEITSRRKAIVQRSRPWEGAFAAVTGLLLAVLASWALATFLFEAVFVPAVLPLVVAFLLVSALTVSAGMLGSRGLTTRPPLDVLRREM